MKILDVEQNSPEWYAARAGMPTASEFSKIVTSKGEPSKSIEEYAITLAGETYTGGPMDPWAGNKYTDRGKDTEADAIAFYEFARDVTIERVGFVTNDDETVGCSPDGLVGDDGGVEIKVLKPENHIKALMYFRKNGKCPPTYVQQTQGQMWIAERKWMDLFFYHPILPTLIIRQTPDTAVMDGIKDGIPTLLSRRGEIVDELRLAEAR